VDRLRDLYLFTFVNASTTNPTAMTAWNARMLRELWLRVSDLIEGRRVSSNHIRDLREQVLKQTTSAHERAALEGFLAEMPERYLLANSARDVLLHERVANGRGDGPRVYVTSKAHGEDTFEVIVVTDDRPGLLADLAAALSAHRYNVDSAQVYTRKRPGKRDEAVDIFHVTHPGDGAEGDMQDEIAAFERTIEQLESGSVTAERLVGRRGKAPSWARTGPRIKTEVIVDNNASSRYTVVDIYTRDRAELLHAIARTFHRHGLSIVLAKVNTEGRRVADVFYVEAEGGGKLAGDGQLARLSESLRETIHRLDM
jgi:[protein-PII] uridylyltransferase